VTVPRSTDVVLNYWHRDGVGSDLKALTEVIEQSGYERPKKGFVIEPGETWLDGGANSGAFTLLALSRGAHVLAVEPHPDNCHLWEKNVHENFPGAITKKNVALIRSAIGATQSATEAMTQLHCDPRSHWRHTTTPINLTDKKTHWQVLTVPVVSLATLLSEHPQITAIKLDIEGAELDILDSDISNTIDAFKNIQKFVFEYHLDRCEKKSRKRYNKICDNLRKIFEVTAPKIDLQDPQTGSGSFDYYPPAKVIVCKRK
jgi:FkbM family methyltransferase